jgi:hypothetical protein
VAEPFISFAFSAGVLSPSLLSRPDLEKYDLALRDATNWIVDYRGGIVVRPSMEFLGINTLTTERVRLVPFQFNLFSGNNYLLIFGEDYIRVMRNGAFVVDSSAVQNITSITNADPAVVTTSGSHGLSVATEQFYLRDTGVPELDNNLFVAGDDGALTATALRLDPAGLTDPVDLSALGANVTTGTLEPLYEIASPYQEEDLPFLRFDQYRDEIYITGLNYKPRKLVRGLADDSWTLSLVDFEGNRDAPGAPTISIGTATAGGSAHNPDSASTDSGVLYGVTAINQEGAESYLADIGINTAVIDITNNRGFLSLEWTAVSGAVEYNVYRSLILLKGHALTFAQELGYLGKTQAPVFEDTNIIPDFSRTPLIVDNPFSDGAVLNVNITAPGSSYGKDTTTISAADGSGFVGKVIVDSDGEVIGCRILDPGTGYTDSSVVTISDSGSGTGATATITTSPAGGNNPACSTRIQQRRVYAGTENLPMSLFWSRIGAQDSFDFSSLVVADDAFDLSMDSPQLTPIYDVVKVDLGILVFTPQQIMQVRSTEDNVIGPTTSRAENISDQGAEPIEPIRAEDNTLYVTYGSYAVNSIQPTQLRNYYQVQDISIFSNHLFDPDNKIVSWCLTKTPQSIVWAVREDGTLLTMAYKPEQNVYAWTPHDTEGHYEEIVSITEDDRDVVYAYVRRNDKMFVERFDPINWMYERDNFALDSYRRMPTTAKTSVVSLSAWSGDAVTMTSVADTAIFGDVSVGDHILVGGGLLDVTSVAGDEKSVVGNLIYELEQRQKIRGYGYRTYTAWEILPAVTEIRGLYHLEPDEDATLIAIVGDEGQEVTYTSPGVVTFATPTPVRAIGLDFRVTDMVTLPLKLQGAVVEDKKKNISDISVRIEGAAAFAAGTLSTGEFFDIDNAGYDYFELPQYMKSTIYEQTVTSDWRDDDSIVVRKTKPFRGKVLGLVINAEFGLD